MPRDPEDALLRALMRKGHSKASAIRIAKSQGLIQQKGRHLEPTAKGSKAIRRIRRQR